MTHLLAKQRKWFTNCGLITPSLITTAKEMCPERNKIVKNYLPLCEKKIEELWILGANQ